MQKQVEHHGKSKKQAVASLPACPPPTNPSSEGCRTDPVLSWDGMHLATPSRFNVYTVYRNTSTYMNIYIYIGYHSRLWIKQLSQSNYFNSDLITIPTRNHPCSHITSPAATSSRIKIFSHNSFTRARRSR